MTDPEPIPAWLASKLRRAAFFSAASSSFPVAAVALLLAGVNLLWWSGSVESVFVPLFWNAVLLAGMYLLGQDLWRALRIFFRPEDSEETAYLRRLGPLADTVNRVEAELQGSADLTYGKEVAFTQNWLVVSRGSRFAVRRLDDLAWVFMKTTTTLLNWVIPVWRSHSVVFRCAGGPDAEAKCSKEWGAKLIEHAAGRCPWIALGYDEKMDKMWESDRAAFIAAVQKRK